MAPTRSKKRKSTESQSSVDTSAFPAPPQTIPTKTSTPTRTPIRKSPMKKPARGLTANQKQALLDNLQLEITERARKLRAQYMLQAQGLRTRLEIRVNRIPMALRQAKMGDLIMKYHDVASNRQPILPGATTAAMRGGNYASPSRNLVQEVDRDARYSPSPIRPPKRASNEMTDKENDDLSNPKKRTKVAPAPRAVSRKLQQDQVLSPRSANPHTVARQPVRPLSPTKSYLARPVSPHKPAATATGAAATTILTNMVEKAKTTRTTTATKATTATARGRRVAQPAAPAAAAPRRGRGRPSNSSESSDASTRTTVVKPPAKKEPVKRTVMNTIKGMGGTSTKKAAPAAAAAKAAPAGRVLRKRAPA